MFRRVRALIARGHQVADNADMTLEMAKALVADVQDGFKIRVHVDEDAAKTLARLLIGHGGELPLTVSVDPEWDARPPRVASFVGGDHDGKQYVVDPEKTELVLEGRCRYQWDGHVFRYQSG